MANDLYASTGKPIPALGSSPERVLPPNEHFVQLRNGNDPVLGTSIRALELSRLIDVEDIQSLMNQFYDIARIPMAIVDIDGNVLVGAGWQKVCTHFHRVNPETCRNCVESDTQLTAGVCPGEYRLYKCKNNMWDVATPLMVGEHHVGNVFSGQFFFDDEPLERDYFAAQAERYGFDQVEYIAAIEAAPRLSRRTVESGMVFITKLAHIVSEMGYTNQKMAQWVEERKQSEEALIRSEKLASVGRLAATVAHEINNPLEAATNCLYLVNNHASLPRELKYYVEIAERELVRVAHIARQTLGFYRENTKPSLVSVPALVDEVAGLYSPKLKNKEIRLRIEHRGDNPLFFAMAGELRQVISNLLTNAIDASQAHGIVTIRTSCLTFNAVPHTRITVADHGTGIRPQNLGQLFKPFFTTKQSFGTGLGLWVSSEIVRKHGGHIRLRSREEQGTVFSVLLPTGERPVPSARES